MISVADEPDEFTGITPPPLTHRSASSHRPEDTSAATASLTRRTNRACESSSNEPVTARDSRPTCASSTRRARPCAADTWSGNYADADGAPRSVGL
jgi:hypothetical protein